MKINLIIKNIKFTNVDYIMINNELNKNSQYYEYFFTEKTPWVDDSRVISDDYFKNGATHMFISNKPIIINDFILEKIIKEEKIKNKTFVLKYNDGHRVIKSPGKILKIENLLIEKQEFLDLDSDIDNLIKIINENKFKYNLLFESFITKYNPPKSGLHIIIDKLETDIIHMNVIENVIKNFEGRFDMINFLVYEKSTFVETELFLSYFKSKFIRLNFKCSVFKEKTKFKRDMSYNIKLLLFNDFITHENYLKKIKKFMLSNFNFYENIGLISNDNNILKVNHINREVLNSNFKSKFIFEKRKKLNDLILNNEDEDNRIGVLISNDDGEEVVVKEFVKNINKQNVEIVFFILNPLQANKIINKYSNKSDDIDIEYIIYSWGENHKYIEELKKCNILYTINYSLINNLIKTKLLNENDFKKGRDSLWKK